MNDRIRHALIVSIPPLVTLLAMIVLWHLAVIVFQMPPYLVPTPKRVGVVLLQEAGPLARATWLSGRAALCGFAISLGLGTSVAIVFSQSALVRRSLYPYAIFLQTVPIVAIAPLIINWLGPGFWGVVVVSTIISLFPIVASTTAGLTTVPSGLVDLFRLHRANRIQRLFKLQLPHAVPALINGARASSGLAVVGSIVGEFFAGYSVDEPGLGMIITHSSSLLKTDLLFAAMILSALLGVMIFGTVSLLTMLTLRRWYGGVADPNA
ncbi:MAG: ABC transporter permease [Planctomycetales bacterium]|nr:ABC transporter permease [Planctomycetales bacterium]